MGTMHYVTAPAMVLGVTSALLWAQLMPSGLATVVVRVGSPQPEAALAAAAGVDSALVAIPAPGFAVLRGDATRIRHGLGLAVAWQGAGGCAPGSPGTVSP